MTTPRMRMFAGPNGSGKSSFKNLLSPKLQGVYLNPDEIELSLKKLRCLNFENYELPHLAAEALIFIGESEFLKSSCVEQKLDTITANDSILSLGETNANSYLASVLVDFMRSALLKRKISFTFETVMSHRSKISFLKKAQELGYRTYLYYIATEDPLINISRVKNRVSQGGHNVAKDKIKERYTRSLNLLLDAIRLSNRAYIFDNSSESNGNNQTWLAEITDGKMKLKVEVVPVWFRHFVLDKISPPSQ